MVPCHNYVGTPISTRVPEAANDIPCPETSARSLPAVSQRSHALVRVNATNFEESGPPWDVKSSPKLGPTGRRTQRDIQPPLPSKWSPHTTSRTVYSPFANLSASQMLPLVSVSSKLESSVPSNLPSRKVSYRPPIVG